MSLIQWEPENSEIEIRLLESSFNFKKCDEHETQQLSSVSRPILLNQWFNVSNKAICFPTKSNALKYWCTIIF